MPHSLARPRPQVAPPQRPTSAPEVATPRSAPEGATDLGPDHAAGLQDTMGNTALRGLLGRGPQAPAPAAPQAPAGQVPPPAVAAPEEIGTDTNTTEQSVRTGLSQNPGALRSLDTLVGGAGYRQLDAGRQGAVLAKYLAAPNGATARRLGGQIAWHAATDKTKAQADWQDAATPDGGELVAGGASYSVQNGRLLDGKGQPAGEIGTDGNYRLTGDTASRSVYDDIHARVKLTEGSGKDRQTLVDLHDADPAGKLQAQGMNDTATGRFSSVLKDLRRENVDMRVTDGFRSMAQQDALYAQGRTKRGRKVTGVRGGGSYHNYGLAADMAFVQPDNQVTWSESGDHAKLWQRYGQVAGKNGVEWGGGWSGFVDKPHVEYHPGQRGGARSLKGTHDRGGLEAVWDTMGIGEQAGTGRATTAAPAAPAQGEDAATHLPTGGGRVNGFRRRPGRR